MAALSVAAGHRAVLSDFRGPGALVDLVTKLRPLASAATGELAAESGDIVMVRTPLGAYRGIPVEATADNPLPMVVSRTRPVPGLVLTGPTNGTSQLHGPPLVRSPAFRRAAVHRHTGSSPA